MKIKFKHTDNTEVTWTDLSSHKDYLGSIKMANATGYLYIKPKYKKDHLSIIGRFKDGKLVGVGNEDVHPHSTFDLKNWIDYVYRNGHKW